MDCAGAPAVAPEADLCVYANDGECDARYLNDYCTLGTDLVDCTGFAFTCGWAGGDSWDGDGMCDEPTNCAVGSDSDCR